MCVVSECKGKCGFEGKTRIPKFLRQEKICGGSRSQTQTESGVSLDVPPGRSNFARKNASLPRLNITGDCLSNIVRSSRYSFLDKFSKGGINVNDLENGHRSNQKVIHIYDVIGFGSI